MCIRDSVRIGPRLTDPPFLGLGRRQRQGRPFLSSWYRWTSCPNVGSPGSQHEAVSYTHLDVYKRQALAAVEAERREIGQAPGRTAVVGRSRGARSILDDPEAVPVSNGPQLVVVRGLPEDVDGEDPDGARRDRCLDRGRVGRPDVGPDVREDWSRARPHHGVTGGGEGVVADNDLVARPGAEDLQGQVQGCLLYTSRCV